MSIHIDAEIERLLQFALKKEMITIWDVDLARNKLLEVLQLSDVKAVTVDEEVPDSPVTILETILDWAAEQGLIEDNTVTYRDLFDTKIMGCLVPSQGEIIRRFDELVFQGGPKQATEWFYQFSQVVHYIRTDRIAKNEKWLVGTEYGDLQMTINLSKPEKDPVAIAAARNMQKSEYPACLLCKENVGYAGRLDHPARQNHRIIPVTLDNEQWFLQFSPYVYYNEHAIVFSGEHKPMKISKDSFKKLLHFVEQYPHYFLGSNADLPIVGGSILSHDHFQGGHHTFPMEVAEKMYSFSVSKYPSIDFAIVKWPMSVLRLQGNNQADIIAAADDILQEWKTYSDETVEIHAFSGEAPHNTITPIARRRGELFELDLVLRNNRTSDEHPFGIFHPHQEVHHIKKENIGLIEVMGLAVLPGRLLDELKKLAEFLVEADGLGKIEKDDEINKHYEWAKQVYNKYPDLTEANVYNVLLKEVGHVFATILEHAGVFKQDEAGQQGFKRFVQQLQTSLK
ncbi:UDP-glucose--hexose-1-phosphate uridylyltransferase [Metabacillus halosaccharovorans]|uniref:Galactose-1-phosphate uridylyltransferase n=1 Tax=Metabacillus halosaccharovorans TaxID=930124 RepID=A0ABT3DGE8_9BACI|nr:UDP-glucose--hexose-1-phosphate uridylyltransferase [Metabacillus halosaccharovorans]MCV9885747.1 UDP-glucose--hexose-1-phosphate uridylyltransferase [Metabacillus halosaccharovorans]